jgi:hypothetical protein
LDLQQAPFKLAVVCGIRPRPGGHAANQDHAQGKPAGGLRRAAVLTGAPQGCRQPGHPAAGCESHPRSWRTGQRATGAVLRPSLYVGVLAGGCTAANARSWRRRRRRSTKTRAQQLSGAALACPKGVPLSLGCSDLQQVQNPTQDRHLHLDRWCGPTRSTATATPGLRGVGF